MTSKNVTTQNLKPLSRNYMGLLCRGLQHQAGLILRALTVRVGLICCLFCLVGQLHRADIQREVASSVAQVIRDELEWLRLWPSWPSSHSSSSPSLSVSLSVSSFVAAPGQRMLRGIHQIRLTEGGQRLYLSRLITRWTRGTARSCLKRGIHQIMSYHHWYRAESNDKSNNKSLWWQVMKNVRWHNNLLLYFLLSFEMMSVFN